MPPPPAPSERDARDAPLPRSQVRTACAVVGCLVVAVVAALAALVYIALTLVNEFTPPPSTNKDKDKKPMSHRPGPVTPTALNVERAAVMLPAAFDAVGRAANGRYLLLRVPSQSTLHVFDPVETRFIKMLPLGEPNALFAGGAGKLYVYRPKAKELDRYDLVTWEKEETAKKPDTVAAVDFLAVGPGTDAPVLAVGTEVAVVDPAPSAWAIHEARAFGTANAARHARPSADGTVLGVSVRNPDAPEGRLVRFAAPGKFPFSLLGDKAGHVAPSPDGKFAYTARGVFARDGKSALAPEDGYFYTLPTAHGSDLYLSVGVDDGGKLQAPLRLHLAGSRATAGTLAATLPAGLTADDAAEVPMDQRVHLWPAAGLLAVLKSSNQTIELVKVDVPALLAKSGREHLMFATEPPASVSRGAPLMYEAKVWSSAPGPAAFEVVDGPDGMAMSGPDLIWDIPTTGPEHEVTVKLRAKLAGRTAEQSFRVVLVDSPLAP